MQIHRLNSRQVFYRVLFAWGVGQGWHAPLFPWWGEKCIPLWTQMCQRHIPSITPHKRSAVWGGNGRPLLCVSERRVLYDASQRMRARPAGTLNRDTLRCNPTLRLRLSAGLLRVGSAGALWLNMRYGASGGGGPVH